MAKLTTQIQIKLPPNKVWEILSDFGNIVKWGPTVMESVTISPSSQGVGTERRCEIIKLGTIFEKAVEWDEGNSMKIEIKGIPSITSMSQKFSLSSDADLTVVTGEMEVEVEGNDAERERLNERLQRALQMTLQGLKQYAETGQKMTLPPRP